MDALLSRLYDRFLLRDFLGKIVPGTIASIGVGMMITEEPVGRLVDTVRSEFEGSPVAFTALGFGLLWLAGFVVQAPREIYEFFRVDRRQNRETWLDFALRDLGRREQAVERIVVIKEATGNGFVALSVLLLGGWIGPGLSEPAWMSLALAVLLLFFVHCKARWQERLAHETPEPGPS